MEPRIQYATAADGVSIAFWTLGDGPPLICMPMIPTSHVELEWQMAESRDMYEKLAANHSVVRYDNRGSGLSDRIVADYTPKALVMDLEAVVGRLNLDQFALLGVHRSGTIAIAYAAANPEKVTRLMLWSAWARTDTYFADERFKTLRAMLDGDWLLLTETLAREFAGWADGSTTRAVADLIRQSITGEAYRAILDASDGYDGTPFLEQIQCPTLVLHPNNVPLARVELSRRIASGIADSRLTFVDSGGLFIFLGNRDEKLRIIESFLGEDERQAQSPDLPQGTAVILFADIVDSTALTERLGDAAFREKARELDTAMRTIIREHSGTAIEGKLLGDGVLAVFTSARQAIEAALAYGKAGGEFALHLGLHAGDIIREDNNVYGGAVNIASRISGLSAPGELLVSDTVRSLARTSAGVTFEDRGEQALKGIDDPLRVFAVIWS